ncbi:lysophospholipid acyltransferase family protein [Phaeovulum sp.]|uniref:lysophospholipid acyltransferase family protein n=1 Tax=Phaeovulum sp. TaxID=2934796 RepID=UPI00356940FD
MKTKAADRDRTFGNWLLNLFTRGLLMMLLALPYRWRVPFSGWLMARVVSPLAGYSRRIRRNLKLVLPDLPKDEVEKIVREVPDNAGRTFVEIYSGHQFVRRLDGQLPTGPGMEALRAAKAKGQPVLLASGHIGNYDAFRGILCANGFEVGALYRPTNNPWFNPHYIAAMSRIGTPLFERGRPGLSAMVRFLRKGGTLAILIDQHVVPGAALNFFGRPAMTTLSLAELALKYNALVIPIYALRKPDGFGFDIITEAPIEHAAPEVMMQALNDSLERQVRAHMGQWLWAHRRWKVASNA